jgi:hypothetical protein
MKMGALPELRTEHKLFTYLEYYHYTSLLSSHLLYYSITDGFTCFSVCMEELFLSLDAGKQLVFISIS